MYRDLSTHIYASELLINIVLRQHNFRIYFLLLYSLTPLYNYKLNTKDLDINTL